MGGCGRRGRGGGGAIAHNWIKLHPSCLGTHAAIDAAAEARDGGYRPDGSPLVVTVHPVARQAAHLDDVQDGLAAKFSIPYCVSHTLAHGPPGVHDFAALDEETRERSARVSVTVDESVPEWGAVLSAGGGELARIPCPRARRSGRPRRRTWRPSCLTWPETVSTVSSTTSGRPRPVSWTRSGCALPQGPGLKESGSARAGADRRLRRGDQGHAVRLLGLQVGLDRVEDAVPEKVDLRR